MIWTLLALGFGFGTGAVWLLGRRVLWPLGHWRERSVTARSFARAIELRAPQRAGAAAERARLVARAGGQAGIRPSSAARLRLAATLADVGYAAVPYDVLLGDAAGRAETAVIARHPEIGSAMVELVPGAETVAELVRLHSLDPASRSEAAMLAVASAYVQESRASGEAAARARLSEGAGTRFDEAAVRSVLAVVGEDERG